MISPRNDHAYESTSLLRARPRDGDDGERSMHPPLRNERQDDPGHSRRKFLKQSVATGAMVAVAGALPVMAQENAERPGAGNGSPDRRGSVAETLTDFAVRLRYEDLPEDVVRTVKRTILDTIGCAIGGYGQTKPDRVKLAAGGATPGRRFSAAASDERHDCRQRQSVIWISTMVISRRGAAIDTLAACLLGRDEDAARSHHAPRSATRCFKINVLDSGDSDANQSTILGWQCRHCKPTDGAYAEADGSRDRRTVPAHRDQSRPRRHPVNGRGFRIRGSQPQSDILGTLAQARARPGRAEF